MHFNMKNILIILCISTFFLKVNAQKYYAGIGLFTLDFIKEKSQPDSLINQKVHKNFANTYLQFGKKYGVDKQLIVSLGYNIGIDKTEIKGFNNLWQPLTNTNKYTTHLFYSAIEAQQLFSFKNVQLKMGARVSYQKQKQYFTEVYEINDSVTNNKLETITLFKDNPRFENIGVYSVLGINYVIKNHLQLGLEFNFGVQTNFYLNQKYSYTKIEYNEVTKVSTKEIISTRDFKYLNQFSTNYYPSFCIGWIW